VGHYFFEIGGLPLDTFVMLLCFAGAFAEKLRASAASR
jgi:hypothetical protein